MENYSQIYHINDAFFLIQGQTDEQAHTVFWF